MKKPPQLQTERLYLSKPVATDISLIVDYANNENVSKTTLNIPHPYQEEDAIYWINLANQGLKEANRYVFAIRLLKTREFLGGISLTINPRFNRAALGYWLAELFWNQGYITEAVAAVLEFGFEELDLNKIYATHLVENPASGKVMLKNSMIKEGELKEHTKKGEQFRSLVQYRLTRTEYFNNRL